MAIVRTRASPHISSAAGPHRDRTMVDELKQLKGKLVHVLFPRNSCRLDAVTGECDRWEIVGRRRNSQVLPTCVYTGVVSLPPQKTHGPMPALN